MKAEYRNKLRQERVEIDGNGYVEFDFIIDLIDEIESEMELVVSVLEELTLKLY